MTEDQLNFLSIAKDYEIAKEVLSKAAEALQEALAKLPLNSYLQDPETLLVYKVQKPSGTFVYYKDLEYVRTKKVEERQGGLSAKEAKEQGFSLP